MPVLLIMTVSGAVFLVKERNPGKDNFVISPE
jgi:hypothetical protein